MPDSSSRTIPFLEKLIGSSNFSCKFCIIYARRTDRFISCFVSCNIIVGFFIFFFFFPTRPFRIDFRSFEDVLYIVWGNILLYLFLFFGNDILLYLCKKSYVCLKSLSVFYFYLDEPFI